MCTPDVLIRDAHVFGQTDGFFQIVCLNNASGTEISREIGQMMLKKKKKVGVGQKMRILKRTYFKQ